MGGITDMALCIYERREHIERAKYAIMAALQNGFCVFRTQT